MKKFINIFTLLLVSIAFAFTGCDTLKKVNTKDVSKVAGNVTQALLGTVTATMNETAWEAKTLLAKVTVKEEKQNLTIAGTPKSGLDLSAGLDADGLMVVTVFGLEAKTYEQKTALTEVKVPCMVTYKREKGSEKGSNSYFVSTVSTVTITKLDLDKKRVSGTFTATLTNGKMDTDGDFEKIVITDGAFEDVLYLK